MTEQERHGAAAAGVENALGTVGSVAGRAGTWLQERSGNSMAKARPWVEFIDFSAFKPVAPGGFPEYMHRLKANGVYFRYNYLKVGLGLALLSTVTQPLALVGTLLVIVVYFQLFGEQADEEVHVFGLDLDHTQKVGALVVLAGIVFWFAAGGLKLFSAIACSTIFVAAVHGALRVPPAETEAEPIV